MNLTKFYKNNPKVSFKIKFLTFYQK